MFVAKELVLAAEFNGMPPSGEGEVLVYLRNRADVTLVITGIADACPRIIPVIRGGSETDEWERAIADIGDTDNLVPTFAETIDGVALGVWLQPRRDVHQRCW